MGHRRASAFDALRMWPGRWWADAWRRAAFTALATAAAVVGPFLAGTTTGVEAASTIGLAVVASLLTALVRLPEAQGVTASPLAAIAARSLRTFGQVALASGVASAGTLADVDWRTVAITAGGATLVTILRTTATLLETVPSLPETPGGTS